jgi:hypothetical protein
MREIPNHRVCSRSRSASSEFFKDGKYEIAPKKWLSGDELLEYYAKVCMPRSISFSLFFRFLSLSYVLSRS